MELNAILDFIKNNFPDKSIDISESLELLRETIDDVINEVGYKTGQAYKERDFDIIERFTELGKAVDEYEKKIDDIINYTAIERTEDSEVIQEVNNNTDDNKFLVDNKVEHTLYENFTHIRPYGFKLLDDRIIETKTWQAMLINTCEILFKQDEKKFIEFQNKVTMNGKKNKYFSINPEELRRPEIIAGKIFVEINMSSNAIRNLIVKMLNEYGFKVSDYKVYFRADYSTNCKTNNNDSNVNGN